MESEPGVGSTFSFAIPLIAVAAGGAGARAGASRSEAGLILVVEDDRSSADLLRVYLEDAGYAVAVARDGAEGLELARRLEPSAVILDMLCRGSTAGS